MALFLLSGFPALMAAAVFLLRQDRVRKIILFLTSSVHLFVTVGFWQGPRDVQFNPFLGFDAASQLVLTLVSILFFVVSIYLIGYLKEKRRRSNGIFIG